ncbi:MAG: putative NADH-flavin reductase [Chitinophagaceae bacterium]|nr:putative NADH-flavin reductase [Chitinophagaceae bacterium]
MIITVFGATGQVGNRIVKQGLAMGYKMKAFGRNVSKLIDEDLRSDLLQTFQGGVFDDEQVYDAIKGSDAVLSALGGAFDGEDKTRSLGIKNIVKQMDKAGVKRIIALGGLGILNADETHLRIDDPNYPAQYLPVGKEHLKAYQFLNTSDLEWTFVCSPDIKDNDATGNYVTNANYVPEPNKFFINAGDIAHFMLNELNKNEFAKQRVGISN